MSNTKSKDTGSIIKELMTDKALLILALSVFIISVIIRITQIPKGLPHYSIDENDIVEFALGYYGGDLNPHWFKYGPLYSYVLAALYWIISLFQGLNIHLFVENYFEDPSLFYQTSRSFNALIHTGLAFIAFYIGRTFFSVRVALIGFIVAVIPISDALTNYTTRVDSLLAVFMSLSLLFSLHLARDVNNMKWYILAGGMLGFAVATKPLQAVVMMPSIYAAYVVGQLYLSNSQKPKKGTKKPGILSVFLHSVVDRKLYILLLCAFATLFLGHPYLFLDFDAFWRDTFSAVTGDTQAPWPKGYELSRYQGSLGWVFVGAVALSLLYHWIACFKKLQPVLLVLLTYISVYWLVFAFIPARDYFYVVLVPAIAVLLAFSIIQAVQKVESTSLRTASLYGLTVLLISLPIWFGVKQLVAQNDLGSRLQPHPLDAAEAWIDQNVESNEKILFYGYYTSLPKLLDFNPNEQAVYGDYFMYQRGNNEYWVERFSQFMQSVPSRDIKTYDLIYQIGFQVGEDQKSFYTRYDMGEDEQYLYPYVTQSGIPYVVTHYNLRDYPQFQQSLVWSSGGLQIYKVL